MDSVIYHVSRAGEILGEYAGVEFRQRRAAGEIQPTDHFWTEGMSEWQEVSEWRPQMAATVKMIPAPPEKLTPIIPKQEFLKKPSAWQRWKEALSRRGNRDK